MQNLRKSYPPSFKSKVALEALKEEKTSAELASRGTRSILLKLGAGRLLYNHERLHQSLNYCNTLLI